MVGRLHSTVNALEATDLDASEWLELYTSND